MTSIQGCLSHLSFRWPGMGCRSSGTLLQCLSCEVGFVWKVSSSNGGKHAEPMRALNDNICYRSFVASNIVVHTINDLNRTTKSLTLQSMLSLNEKCLRIVCDHVGGCRCVGWRHPSTYMEYGCANEYECSAAKDFRLSLHQWLAGKCIFYSALSCLNQFYAKHKK